MKKIALFLMVLLLLSSILLGGCRNSEAVGGGEDDDISISSSSPSSESQSESESQSSEEPEEPQSIYAQFYFYDESREDRYEAFSALNPETDIEDIVWQVNANADIEPYTEITIIEDTSFFPLLVNKHNALPDDYVPQNLVSLPSGRQLAEEAAENFELLIAASVEDGMVIADVSTYRSIEYQRGLYNSYLENDTQESVDSYSARPGHSEHNTGYAVDVAAQGAKFTRFGDYPESDWIEANAHLYGFIVRYYDEYQFVTGYMGEPWHLTYVGHDVAQIMYDEDIICLEEYYVKYIWNSPNAVG